LFAIQFQSDEGKMAIFVEIVYEGMTQRKTQIYYIVTFIHQPSFIASTKIMQQYSFTAYNCQVHHCPQLYCKIKHNYICCTKCTLIEPVPWTICRDKRTQKNHLADISETKTHWSRDILSNPAPADRHRLSFPDPHYSQMPPGYIRAMLPVPVPEPSAEVSDTGVLRSAVAAVYIAVVWLELLLLLWVRHCTAAYIVARRRRRLLRRR
jgi:hypothetical protein